MNFEKLNCEICLIYSLVDLEVAETLMQALRETNSSLRVVLNIDEAEFQKTINEAEQTGPKIYICIISESYLLNLENLDSKSDYIKWLSTRLHVILVLLADFNLDPYEYFKYKERLDLFSYSNKWFDEPFMNLIKKINATLQFNGFINNENINNKQNVYQNFTYDLFDVTKYKTLIGLKQV